MAEIDTYQSAEIDVAEAETEQDRAVTEALRTLFGYGPGRFPDMQPPRIITWGVAQMRMRRVLADAARAKR